MNPEPTPSSSRWNRTAIWLAVLLVLHVVFAVVMVVVIPRQKKTFDEYNLQLPWLSKTVIDLAAVYTRFWWLILPVQLSVTVVGVIFGRHAFRRPTPGTVFALIVLIVLLMTFFVTAVAFDLPQLKLAEGLAK